MTPAISVLVNGLAGVFTGIGVLYLVMKLLSALAASTGDAAASSD